MMRLTITAAAVICCLLFVSGGASAFAPFCGDPRLVHDLDGPIVITVTLQSTHVSDDRLPVFGLAEERFMRVTARLDKVNKGTFRLPAGSLFGLAVHSIALSFGYDSAGEQYVVALKPRGGETDYTVIGYQPLRSTLMCVHAEIVSVMQHPRNPKTVRIDREVHDYVTLLIKDVDNPASPFLKGAIVDVGVYSANGMSRVGEEVCIVMMSRNSRKDSPLRIRYTVHHNRE